MWWFNNRQCYIQGNTDITYESLGKAFNQKLVHHDETIRRMREMNKQRKWIGTQNAEQLAATHRMALFPEKAEVLFIGEDIWVVSVVCLSNHSYLIMFAACRPTCGQTLYFPWHPYFVPENATWTYPIPSTSPCARTATPNTSFHGVGHLFVLFDSSSQISC